jgi:hypothetical protein
VHALERPLSRELGAAVNWRLFVCCRICLPIPVSQLENPRGVGKGRLLTLLRPSSCSLAVV